MNRRSFIKRSLLATTAVTGAGAGYLSIRGNSELATPIRALYVLDEVGFGVLVAFAEPVLPVPGVDYREIAHLIDGSLRFLAPEAQSDINLALGVLENSLAGVFTRGSMRLFSELTPEGRAEAIHRWGDAPATMLRGASNSLRRLVLAVHYAPMANSKEVGYPGPPFDPPDPGPLEPRRAISKPWTAPAAPQAQATSPTSSPTEETE